MTAKVGYKCQILTKKFGFCDVLSNITEIQTEPQSITYKLLSTSNESLMNFIVNPNNDFEKIDLTCTVIDDHSNDCKDLTKITENCTTSLQLRGTRGCDYDCFFTTTKVNYTNIISEHFNYSIYPPEPEITKFKSGARWISIDWMINEIANIQSFNIISNDTIENRNETTFLTNRTNFSHTYRTSIMPFRSYILSIELISNQNVSSNNITIKTLQESPPKPNPSDIESKLVPKTNHPSSSYDQFVIEIDPSLFSDDYGPIERYFIYVRKDRTQNSSEIVLNGTYDEAKHNQSIDYLAAALSIGSLTRTARNNISILLGNETQCENGSAICNGPLEPSTYYNSVIVSGCNNANCTNVLSRAFQTGVKPSPPSKPAYWLLVFAALGLVAIGLLVWKRKLVKELINKNVSKYKKTSRTSRTTSIEFQSFEPIIPRRRPKPLRKYINMSSEDERAIYKEYQELDNEAPPYRQSDYDPEYSTRNRYANIPARGPWNKTAVRLNGDDRFDDYINANEIRGLNNEKHYIACQGPLPDTCQDFWEMIIQYHVSKIVMLTRTEEKNPHNPSQTLQKCSRYFPRDKGDTLQYGKITVQVLEVDTRACADLEIRLILVKDDQSEQRIHHYYFTGWPDFGVVDIRKLLELLDKINNHGQKPMLKDRASHTPIVVHCSAGVGRTGTYIAVDMLTQLINQAGDKLPNMELDVMGIVSKLREDRVKMVQTKDQYMLVNRSVEEHLKRINRLNDVLQESNEYESPTYVSPATIDSIYLNEKSNTNNFHERSSLNKTNKKERDSSSSYNRRRESTSTQRRSKPEQPYEHYYGDVDDDKAPPIPDRNSSK
ncbi:hypothetical protein I4U23_021639 [Adineta vaga]|nr:hypothetical protein I4U23_021639 [Adineta vaga]